MLADLLRPSFLFSLLGLCNRDLPTSPAPWASFHLCYTVTIKPGICFLYTLRASSQRHSFAAFCADHRGRSAAIFAGWVRGWPAFRGLWFLALPAFRAPWIMPAIKIKGLCMALLLSCCRSLALQAGPISNPNPLRHIVPLINVASVFFIIRSPIQGNESISPRHFSPCVISRKCLLPCDYLS